VLATDDSTLKGRINEGKQSSADKRDIDGRVPTKWVHTVNKANRVIKITRESSVYIRLESLPSEMNLALKVPVPANSLSCYDSEFAIRRCILTGAKKPIQIETGRTGHGWERLDVPVVRNGEGIS